MLDCSVHLIDSPCFGATSRDSRDRGFREELEVPKIGDLEGLKTGAPKELKALETGCSKRGGQKC